MRRIILFHPRTLHEANYRYFYIPYSVMAPALLLRNEFDVIVIDNNDKCVTDFRALMKEEGEAPVCVGVSVMMGQQIREALTFSEVVKTVYPECPVVWGGPLPTMTPELAMSAATVDVIVRGQGEKTLLDIARCLANGDSLTKVAGIYFRDGTGWIRNREREFVATLDEFPPYSSVFDLIDVEAYARCDEHISSRTVSYHSSQGCPFNCGFCCETALWKNRWAALSASRILGDISWLVERYGINGIKFYDSEFFIDRNRANTFAAELLRLGIPIRWAASVHPLNVARLSEDELGVLAKSGLSRLLIGAESGVEDELKLIGKKSNRELIVNIARRLSRVGIVGSFTFVTGYPESPRENIDRTLEFGSDLRSIDSNHEIKVHFYAPYPGTPLYEYALRFGFTPPKTLLEWAAYDYYDIVTPWVPDEYQKLVREFNEEHYPYLHAVVA